MNENPKPYQAIIKGKRCKVAWDENQDNVLLVDSVPHEVGVMEQSLDVLRKQRLLSISELKFGGSTSRAPKGWWLVEGKHPGHWIIEASGDSRRLTYEYLDQVLSKDKRPARFTEGQLPLPTVAELRTSAAAVAFVKEQRICFDDGKSMLLPIFLSTFKPMNNTAEINGERVRVKGWDDSHNLVLEDGRRFSFQRLGEDAGDEPGMDVDLKCKRLIKVARLEAAADGGWILNGAPLFLPDKPPHGNWTDDEFRSLLLHARQISNHNSSKVAGVAWFAGIEAPVLLRSFRELLPSSAVSEPSKGKKARRKKPVARFENDFTIAMVPQKSGKEIPLALGMELQMVVKEIIRAGGRLTGPKLIANLKLALKRKSDVRPDRWFKSPVAVSLCKARLLGQNNPPGRIVVYWAKERAD